MSDLYSLDHRKVLSISGEDRYSFLQGLITKNVEGIKSGLMIYALFLSPKGRIDFDLFLFERNEKIFIDTDQKDELFQRLSLFKLRSRIKIQKENLLVYASYSSCESDFAIGNNDVYVFSDPRDKEMGCRIYTDEFQNKTVQGKEAYDAKRLSLNIPDGIRDMPKGRALPMEWGMDELHAIDFDKGCYIGQELTTRTKFGVLNVNKQARFLTHEELSGVDEKQILSQYESGAFVLMSIG